MQESAAARNTTADYSLEDWHRLININLNGVFYCMKYEIAAILGRGGGAIVNMSSILGSVGLPSAPAYTAAKHAVVGLTKVAAMEYARIGHPHQCRWAGLDRHPAFVGLSGGGKQTHGSASAYGQARARRRRSRLSCASCYRNRPASLPEATTWWMAVTPRAKFAPARYQSQTNFESRR